MVTKAGKRHVPPTAQGTPAAPAESVFVRDAKPADVVNDLDVSSEYVIGPDDVVRLIIEQHPEWSGEFPVRPDGNIFISGIGEFRMEGHTKETAQIALAAYLEKLIINPRVTVGIVRFASQVIYVLGQVERPGKYSTEGRTITVRDAVLLAGLPRRFAATDRVYVIRPAMEGKPRQTVVNLRRILDRGELRHNVKLNPGDVVYVPQTVIGMVADFVASIVSPFSEAYPAARTAVATPMP
jgi:polysaccharide export outer membrane protein